MEQRTLGDYRMIKPIGLGTLGAVYLAEHRFMKRQYTLKILPDELSSDKGFIQRFEEEVSVLSSLDHPNIVKIHNISFAQGHYFLVSDCIVDDFGETTNLAKYLMGLRQPLEEEEMYDLLHQIAYALDYAHTKKVGSRDFIHRCLKPNNILIGKQKKGAGEKGVEVFVSDFGLSRMIGPGAVLTRTYKNVAEALGIAQQVVLKAGHDQYPNPPVEQQKLIPLHASFLQNYAFLAPEQKRLDLLQPVDIKVDVYAFGILAYFLIMNELPEGIFDLPSSRSSYQFQWDHLINSCLKSHPSHRPDQLLPLLESIRPKMVPIIEDNVINIEDTLSLKGMSEEGSRPSEVANKYAINSEEVKTKARRDKENERDEVEEKFVELYPQESLVSAVVMENNQQETTHQSLRPVLQNSQLERPQTDLDPGAIFQVNSSVKAYNPERKEVANIKPLLTEMMIISGGNFFRGSQDGNRDEMPRHQVMISSFAIDIHPVTNEQFVRFLEVMGGEKDSNHNDIIRLRDSRIKRSAGKLSIESGYSKHPVVGVTWYGAVAYAKWVGKRLPTEAEWEIAARGGREHTLYPTGDDIEKTQANFFSSDTTTVMSYAPNEYGLYDMAGNVYEWCYDWYGYNYYEVSLQEPDNPQGPLQGVYRVLRGGCWKSLKEDLRCSRRHRNNPNTVNGTYGFRCVSGVQNS